MSTKAFHLPTELARSRPETSRTIGESLGASTPQLDVQSHLYAALTRLGRDDLERLLEVSPRRLAQALVAVAGSSRESRPRPTPGAGLMATRAAAEREAGGLIGASELARRLGKSRQTLKNWGDAHLLLGVDDNGTRRYPACQFDAHGQILPGLDLCLKVLAEGGITSWMALDTLTGSDPLFGQSALELLRAGRVDDALRIAHAATDAGAA